MLGVLKLSRNSNVTSAVSGPILKMRSSATLSGKHISYLTNAIALSALATILATRFSIWFPPSLSHLWTAENLLDAFSACFEDSIILALVFSIHLIISRFTVGRKMNWFISFLLIAVYWLFALSLVLNAFSIFSLGTTLDTKWFSYLTPRNAGLSIPALLGVITPSMIILLCSCAFIFPMIAYFLNVGRIGISRIFQLGLVLVFSSGIITSLLPPKKAIFQETTLKSNPQFANFKALLFPTINQRLLRGETNIYPEVDSKIHAETAAETKMLAQSKLVNAACCKRANIVMITVDSLPYKSVSRETVLTNSNKFPNLARLYKEGISFERFYTNYPSSTEAHGIIAGSVYASNVPYQNSISEWVDRKVPTLYEILAKERYDSALFMSDDLVYDNVAKFLKGRGFSKTSDSRDLNCSKNDAQILLAYGHKGDDCNALAAANWLKNQSKKPFFLWTWFTNTHAPYYSERFKFKDKQAPMAVRHSQSIQDTDKAIGIILNALDQQGHRDNTIIILSADHGEAFGEHGLFYHGTSIHEEQTHIPLIISGPSLKPNSSSAILGSNLDLAPTILSMIGVSQPASWQGTSLFSNPRPKRVFMSSLSAGHIAGYVEGNYKFVISSLEPETIKFDLLNDPQEKRPIIIKGKEAELVSSRIGAFTRNRNKMRWPKR
jgi:arylsulfatase A-like enzyme